MPLQGIHNPSGNKRTNYGLGSCRKTYQPIKTNIGIYDWMSAGGDLNSVMVHSTKLCCLSILLKNFQQTNQLASQPAHPCRQPSNHPGNISTQPQANSPTNKPIRQPFSHPSIQPAAIQHQSPSHPTIQSARQEQLAQPSPAQPGRQSARQLTIQIPNEIRKTHTKDAPNKAQLFERCIGRFASFC